MPSLTLLAADPHLTPVRARPSLVFGGRSGSTVSGMKGALRRDRGRRASLSLWRRRMAASPASRRRPILGWRPAVAVALVALIGAGLGVMRVWPPFAVVMS